MRTTQHSYESEFLPRCVLCIFKVLPSVNLLTVSQLQIYDDEQKRFSIYRTEIGRYAISDALSDEDLMALFRERGDERGSIKLLVSHSQAPVHESPPLSEVSQPSPIHTITPPVLPQHSYPPLRPRRRSKSRRGSTSSVSERLPPDQLAVGYEASVSDDLDHVEPRRTTIRALPQQPSVPRQPLPQPPRPKSPVTYGRPPSPGSAMSPDRTRMQRDDMATLRADRLRGNLVTTPPSTSPDISRSQDPPQPTWYTHGRAGSDAALDRERVTQLIDFGPEPSRPEQSPLRRTREQDDMQRSRRAREMSRKETALSRAKPGTFAPPEPESRRRVEGWDMVPSNVPSSSYKKERPPTPSEPRPSPSRPHAFINLPPQRPPPAPPVADGQRNKRLAGKAVPPSYVISYKGPGAGAMPQSPPATKTLNKMMIKSMNDLHSKFKQTGAGSSRKPNAPLPMKPNVPGTSNTMDQYVGGSNHSENISSSYHDSPLYNTDFTKTYDGSRYPGLSPSSSHYTGRPPGPSAQSPPQPSGSNTLFAGPAQEPYPRPRSAAGNAAITSPYRSTRTLQSPNHPDFPSPETPQHRASPSGPSHYYPTNATLLRDDGYHTGTGFGPRPNPSHARHDRSNTDGTGTFPPRSPIGAKPSVESRDLKPPEQIQRTLSSLPVREDEPSSAESTIRHDDWRHIQRMLGGNSGVPGSSGSNTVVPQRPLLPYMNSASAASASSTILNESVISSTNSSTGHSSVHSDDTDSEAGTIWAKAPPKLGNPSRPILPPIDTDSSPSSKPASLAPERPPLPSYIPDTPPARSRLVRSRAIKDQRTSRFDNNFDFTWAPRPPPEEVLQRLEEYFPEHDVDEPVIDAPSGGTSPTSTTAEPGPNPLAERRARHKKSIRVVAAERRRIDRTSHMEPTASTAGAALRKRNTKL